MVETSYPEVKLTAAPTITIGDINDITGTITDKTGWVLSTTSTVPVSFATTSTVQALNSGVGYTPIKKNARFTVAQSSTIFWQPASGKKWYLTDLIISSLNAVTIDLIDTTSTLTTLYFAANGGLSSNFKTPLVASATNGTLLVTTTAATLSILASGYEV